ncbi:MAG: hypothetical protein ACREJ6_03015 [Candidatus Methylomirabilis sp.]
MYLFSHLARRRFGLRVERVHAGYPDCLAYKDGKRVRIEFEYRSRNFAIHRHNPRGCDWIVCWIHDWPGVPSRLRVVELRKEFGVGFNVWLQPVADESREDLAGTNFSDSWSVPRQAMDGDLLLFYRTAPDSFIRDIFRLTGPVQHRGAGWKPGKDWMASIRRLTTLAAPLHLTQLRHHPILRDAGFVRGSMRRRYRATEYWPDLYTAIVATNPAVAKRLRSFGPERLS